MKTKTTILYIFQDSSIGGGPYCLLRLIEQLDKELFNPIVLLKVPGPLSVELEKLGVQVYFDKWISEMPYNKSLFNLTSLWLVFSTLVSLRKIKSWIKKTDADIIHLNTMLMYPYLRIVKRLNKKGVIHIREFWPNEEHQFQFSVLNKRIQKYADKIIAINESSAKMIGKSAKVHIVFDWVNFKNRSEKIDFETLFGKDYKALKIFTFLGGTNWIKGGLEIVEAFSNPSLPDNIRLLLVGSNKEEVKLFGMTGIIKKILAYFNYYRYSDQVIDAAKKNSKVVLMPKTNHIKSLLEQSYSLISYYTVPHANLPLAEACWLGVPAIAAETLEAKEYSNDGKSALLFKMNDKEDFKNKISFAIVNGELIKANATNGMASIQKKFNPIINSNLIKAIYSNLIIANP